MQPLAKIAREPELASKLQGLGLMPSFTPSFQFGMQLAVDLAFFTAMLKEIGIKLEN